MRCIHHNILSRCRLALTNLLRRTGRASIGFLLLISTCFCIDGATAQDRLTSSNEEAPVTYDELSVLVVMERYKDYYVDALYSSDGLLYICVEDLFKPVGISYAVSQRGDSLSGFWGEKRVPFLLDYNNQKVQAGKLSSSYHRGLVLNNGTLYMESTIFVNVFGMKMNFNFRMLTLNASLGFEPPVYKQRRLEKQRIGLNPYGEEVVADTVVKRNYHFFKPGTFDWAALAYQKWNGSSYEILRAGVGAELLYGQADFSVYYNTSYKLNSQNLYYLWKWVDNDKSLVRQAQVGRINYKSIAFINAPLIGASLRNTPTTLRKAKGFYTLSESTNPNWTVELYINDVLVDYTKADASGQFSFKVPLVYGSSRLKLKYYGPLGEERIDERSVNLPYNLVPKGEFDYGVAGGVVQDTSWSKFGKAEVDYGITNSISVGGGVEYLSSITSGEYIPFARFAVQPFSRMVISGEYAHDVKTQGILSYYVWKDLLVELDYTKFVKGQKATISTAQEERKVRLFFPFKIKSLPFLTRFEFFQQVYRTLNFNYASAMLSMYYRQFSANSTTSLNWVGGRSPDVLSNLALSYRLPLGFTIRPSVLANLSDSKVIMYRAELEKMIPRGYMSLSYQHFVQNISDYVSLNLRYDLSFARVGATVGRLNSDNFSMETVQGGMAFGGGNGYTYFSNNSSVGKGGLLLFPFLDLNQNGEFDEVEKMLNVSSVKTIGGKVVRSTKDSIIRIVDLMPFTYQLVELEDQTLDNISWRFKHKTYKILIDPNQFKRVNIPVIVVGEVNGVVSVRKDDSLIGQGRLIVKIYKEGEKTPAAETMTESDGYFTYVGLEKGRYVACIDSTQLQRLDYSSTPPLVPFTIRGIEEGDIVSDVNFVLRKRGEVDAVPQQKEVDVAEEVANLNDDNGTSTQGVNIGSASESSSIYAYTLLWGTMCEKEGYYYVQCGAFRKESYAMKHAQALSRLNQDPVGVVLQNGYYKVRVGCVEHRREAVTIQNKIPKTKGKSETLIVKRKIYK